MGESPPWGGGPPDGSDRDHGKSTKGESDPLFNPPGLKTRKTFMGLAPAPHLGGANRNALSEAEARKQRVLARLAAMDPAKPHGPTVPPPPPTHSTAPPPAVTSSAPAVARVEATGPAKRIIEETYIGPPAFGQTTAIMMGPVIPRTASSDNQLPAADGWDYHNVPDAEVVEPAPTTARMLRPAGPANVQAATSHDPTAPTGAPPQAALIVRPYEPSRGRDFGGGSVRHALSGPLDKRLILLQEPHSTRAASFRVLRDNLLAKSMPRVVAITSARPNDGKTTCAVNLALALGELSGMRVLLIDANYFSPDLADVFTLDRLSPATPPDAAAWLAPYKLVEVTPSLHVAGIPRSAGEAAKRFDHHRFDDLVDRLVRVSYDFVVIDTPALRGTPAVTQLVSIADGALLVVRSGETTTRDLRRAAEQLPPKKALGITLMDAYL